MSLKEENIELFSRYGLNETEIKVLLAYLGFPQSTASWISVHLGMELETVEEITKKLVEAGFIREIPGIIPRYIPLEPYFSLFVHESEQFRKELERIKDELLADQSKRFKDLESIGENSVNEVNEAVNSQLDEFFRVSDEHDAEKKSIIDNARDRFESEATQLESEIHSRIDKNYDDLSADVRKMEADAAAVWDKHSEKFTADNNALNEKLTSITNSHISVTEKLEKDLHEILNDLNSKLKSIADGFIAKYEGGINDAKSSIEKIIGDLLQDFTDRVNNLEKTIKKDLDEHVEKHKQNVAELKPTLERILKKYMDRMRDVVENLKKTITKLLYEHIDHIKSTTDDLERKLHRRVEERQDELVGQVKSFRENTLVLIENLTNISEHLESLSNDLAKRGSAFKALLFGKHKKWVALKEEIVEKISTISENMKEDFGKSTEEYIEKTKETKDTLKREITEVMNEENEKLKRETDELDKKAQERVNAELEGLAGDLSTEIDNTMKKNVEHCGDTTVKLKDLVEKNFSTHKTDYDAAINRHLRNTLDHYNDSDKNVKTTVNDWYAEMDREHGRSKTMISEKTSGQISEIKKYLEEITGKNNEHSKIFENDKEEVKKQQNSIYTERLDKIRADLDDLKKFTTDKIHNEISLFSDECKQMDDALHAMLEDHKSKYRDTATSLQQSLTKTITDNVQNTKDAIADFTLQFMNSIDEANELAVNNEEKLTDIFNASKSIIETPSATTWHIVGKEAIIKTIVDFLGRVKSSIIVVTDEVYPEILEQLSQAAYKRRAARFNYTTQFSPEYDTIIQKMKALGNIQFRQLKAKGEFIACTRDAEEVLLAPVAKDDKDMIAIVSTQEGYTQLYSQIIGPVFMANSRPM